MGILSGIKRIFGGSAKGYGADELLSGVREAYSAVAEDPARRHSFPVGKEFAESVGYPRLALDTLPAEVSDSFAGVGDVAVFAEIASKAVVLDIGCGAGLDSLIAAGKAGPDGRVIGLDFSRAMLDKAMAARRRAGVTTVAFCCGAAGYLPIGSGAIDVVLVNGIFNLNPERRLLFQEMARVVRPGGAVFAAELVFTRPQVNKPIRNLDDWFS